MHAVTNATALRVMEPRTDYIQELLGTDVLVPRLSWRIEADNRNVEQVTYRIRVARSPDHLTTGRGIIWDTGAVKSDATHNIPYGGSPLGSCQRIWWFVEVVDNLGRVACSEPTWFETGLTSPDEWRAQWIEIEDDTARADRLAAMEWVWSETAIDPRPHAFRLDIITPQDLMDSDVLIACKDYLLGVWVNGTKVSVPEQKENLEYWGMVTPVECTLRPDHNSICIAVKAETEGFYPADGGAMASLIRLHRKDGTTERVTSGPNWRVTTDPVEGWTEQAFDAVAWPVAQKSGSLAQYGEPLPPEKPMLARTEFTTHKKIINARLYATALGAYDANINGKPVTDAILSPEISVTKSHTFYQCFDVTALVQTGENALGFTVADGFYAGAFTWWYVRYGFGPAPRRLLAQLCIQYSDGTSEWVCTGPDWKIAPSPFLEASLYDGETYDARLEPNGWDKPGFDHSVWQPANVGAVPNTNLVPLVSPPVRRQQELTAHSVIEAKSGVFIFDFGQNFSGWAKLKVKGTAGTEIILRFSELQDDDGRANQSNLRRAKVVDRYILKGDPNGETYEPRFTYHGFRYVEVEGFPGTPTTADVRAIVVNSDCTETGHMEFQAPLLDKFWNNALWSQRSNFFCVPTDCPQRDERMGWMGDIQIFLDAAAFNMDVNAFIRRFLREARGAQSDNGAYPIVVPQPLSFPDVVTAGWSEAGIILPHVLWQRYGDTAVIDENWAAMEKWMAYLADQNPDFIWREGRGIDLGDWLSVDAIEPDDETTPRVLCATAYWAFCAKLMSEMATVTGRDKDAARYALLLEAIKGAAVQELIAPDGVCGNGSQTSQVLSLYMELVPNDQRAAAATVLVDEIKGRGTKLSTGFLGTPYLLDVLAEAGHWDTVADLLLQEEYPSWGYMVKNGATTMWERWNGDTTEQSMNSYNHYAFGAVVGFFYRRLAGIAPASPGFRRIDVRPKYLPKIGRVTAQYQSCVGLIATEIDGDENGLSRLALTVPANTIAEVELPAGFDWSEGQHLLTNSSGIRQHSVKDGCIRFEVGSGHYIFTR